MMIVHEWILKFELYKLDPKPSLAEMQTRLNAIDAMFR
jgi:hypothetical protein